MPVDENGIGHSQATLYKEASLGVILRTHTRIVAAIQDKYPWVAPHYYYIDMNAGCGHNDDENCEGSPLVFLKAISAIRRPYRAHLIELNASSAQRLQTFIDAGSYAGARIHIGDNEVLLPGILDSLVPPVGKEAFGLVYSDPNGIPNFDLIGQVSRHPHCQKMDILIRYSGASVKRNQHITGLKILDYLSVITKKFWFAQSLNSNDKWQWTFLFGTNYWKYPKMVNIGFFRIDSSDGQAIIERLNYTNKELKEREQSSFFTGLTPNISDSQSSRP